MSIPGRKKKNTFQQQNQRRTRRLELEDTEERYKEEKKKKKKKTQEPPNRPILWQQKIDTDQQSGGRKPSFHSHDESKPAIDNGNTEDTLL
jgi:hypothetical protein